MSANRIHWLGHASVLIEGKKNIYIDPWELKPGLPQADIILITHSHYDHCSRPDIERISTPETVIFAPPDCAECLPAGFHPVSPGMETSVAGVGIETIPAYNIGKQFHPRENNWVGYLVEMGGEKIYHAGDTDYIPEMERIAADTVLLPVGGTYTMDPEQAARAADRIGAKLAIPIHYNRIVGSTSEAKQFRELTKVPVAILPEE